LHATTDPDNTTTAAIPKARRKHLEAPWRARRMNIEGAVIVFFIGGIEVAKDSGQKKRPRGGQNVDRLQEVRSQASAGGAKPASPAIVREAIVRVSVADVLRARFDCVNRDRELSCLSTATFGQRGNREVDRSKVPQANEIFVRLWSLLTKISLYCIQSHRVIPATWTLSSRWDFESDKNRNRHDAAGSGENRSWKFGAVSKVRAEPKLHRSNSNHIVRVGDAISV